MRRKWPLRGRDEGAVAVEAAITLSVLLLLILGIIEFAVAFWQWNTMLLAVEQAGRYVMINNASCGTACAEAQIQKVLTNAAVCTTPLSLAAGQMCVQATTPIPVASPPCPDATTPCMQLAAYYDFDFLALTGSFTIASSNTVPLD